MSRSSFRRIGGASEFIVPVYTKIKLPPRVSQRETRLSILASEYVSTLDSKMKFTALSRRPKISSTLGNSRRPWSNACVGAMWLLVCTADITARYEAGFRAIFSCTLEPRLRTRSRFVNSLPLSRQLLRVEHESRRSTLTFRAVTWKESFAKILRAIVKANLILGLCRREVNSRRWELAKRF